MKLVKSLAFAVVLASILSVSTFAGEQSTPGRAGSSTPSPTPQSESISISDDGTVISDPNDGSTETSDYLFYEALAALLSMY
jgi:hypothetical protein